MDDELFQEAYSRVLYLTEQGKRFGLLLGPPQSGKSELLQRLRQSFLDQGHHVWFFDFSHSETIVPALVQQLQEHDPARFQDDSSGILWTRLNQALLREFQKTQDQSPVPMVLLDHVDLYDQNVVQELVRLIRFHDVNHIPRVFLATVNFDFVFSLNSHLLDRIDLKIEIG